MSNRDKFRVWDIEEQKYVKGFVLIEDGRLVDTMSFETCDKTLFSVEYCTGLYDKNSNLIYEGDIITLDDEEYSKDDLPISIVKEYGEIDVTALNIEYDITLLKWAIDNASVGIYHIEIIGNIHENPGVNR